MGHSFARCVVVVSLPVGSRVLTFIVKEVASEIARDVEVASPTYFAPDES